MVALGLLVYDGQLKGLCVFRHGGYPRLVARSTHQPRTGTNWPPIGRAESNPCAKPGLSAGDDGERRRRRVAEILEAILRTPAA